MAMSRWRFRILAAVPIAIVWTGSALPASAPPGLAEPSRPRTVPIYVENIPHMSLDLKKARIIVSQIYSTINVRLIWLDSYNERTLAQDGTIIVKLSEETPKDFQPGALAVSFPYEGIHAKVLYDRVRQMVIPERVPILLAHVLAHELAHLLGATDAHSATGIMKVCWNGSDYDQMAQKHLTFTDFDVHLIYAGLDARASRKNP